MTAAALACLAWLAGCARAGSPADVIQGLLDQSQPVEATFSLEVPHPELRSRLDGFLLTPALGARSGFDFVPDGDAVEARGELCLLQDEVAPLSAAAEKAGFRVGAPHAHFAGETPRLLFVRLSARGTRDAMTEAARRTLAALRERRVAAGLQPGPTRLPAALEAGKLERASGARAKEDEGVVLLGWGPGESAAAAGTMEKALVVVGLPAAEGRAKALAKAGFTIVPAAPDEARAQAVGRPEELLAALRAVLKKEAPGR